MEIREKPWHPGKLRAALLLAPLFTALFTALFAGGCGREAPARAAAADLEIGKASFEIYCAACHHPDGLGMKGGAPPLEGSPWVAGSEERLIRIVLHGVSGALEVRGQTYNLEMPDFGHVLSDGQVAAVLSYLRSRFARDAPSLTPEAVARVRAATRGRNRYWTAAELLQIR